MMNAKQIAYKIIDENNGYNWDEEMVWLAIRYKKLLLELERAKGFAEWVETLGRTDCEVYKHELLGNANLSIERIEKFLNEEQS